MDEKNEKRSGCYVAAFLILFGGALMIAAWLLLGLLQPAPHAQAPQPPAKLYLPVRMRQLESPTWEERAEASWEGFDEWSARKGEPVGRLIEDGFCRLARWHTQAVGVEPPWPCRVGRSQ